MAEKYYSLTDIIKLMDNLKAAMPSAFYNGIMVVRNKISTLPAADVVARDCFDRILAENDDLRAVRPRATGFWIEHDDDNLGLTYECSYCRTEGMMHGHYCPNCGAKMEE